MMDDHWWWPARSRSAAACVPRGDPPQGRQIVADRVSFPVYVVPSAGDGTTRVFVTRPAVRESPGST